MKSKKSHCMLGGGEEVSKIWDPFAMQIPTGRGVGGKSSAKLVKMLILSTAWPGTGARLCSDSAFALLSHEGLRFAINNADLRRPP